MSAGSIRRTAGFFLAVLFILFLIFFPQFLFTNDKNNDIIYLSEKIEQEFNDKYYVEKKECLDLYISPEEDMKLTSLIKARQVFKNSSFEIDEKITYILSFAERRKAIVDEAYSLLGIRYVWGGENPQTGLDCSGLTRYVYNQLDIYLNHYTGDQWNSGKRVSKNELLPGDLVFFGNPIHHVGIYIGNDQFIHAPHSGDIVKITTLSSYSGYTGAVRLI